MLAGFPSHYLIQTLPGIVMFLTSFSCGPNMKRQKGITLIEVMIFIAIIGIVVSVTRGAIDRYKAEHARDSNPRVEFHGVK